MTTLQNLARGSAALLAALASAPAAAQDGYKTSAEIPVTRAQYEPLWSGLHTRVHAGEQVLVTVAGQVCVNHVHRTERRGGVLGIGRKKVTIDHHTLHDASALPPVFRLVMDEAGQAPAPQTGTSVSFTVPAATGAGARTVARLEAFIPVQGARHQLAYNAQVAVSSQGRLAVLRDALARRGWTKAEVERDDFFSERVRQQYPDQLAEMLVAHAGSPVWRQDAAERKRLLEFAMTLAPTNPVVLGRLGGEYLAQGDYTQAQAVLRDALQRERQVPENNRNHEAYGKAAMNLAETYFQQGMALSPADVMEARQLLGEAVRVFADGSGRNPRLRAHERDARVRLAEMLARVRTVEALRQAAQEYALAGAIPVP